MVLLVKFNEAKTEIELKLAVLLLLLSTTGTNKFPGVNLHKFSNWISLNHSVQCTIENRFVDAHAWPYASIWNRPSINIIDIVNPISHLQCKFRTGIASSLRHIWEPYINATLSIKLHQNE